jgi:hypothetical protein
MIKDIRQTRREGNLAEGLVIVSVDQASLGKALAHAIKALLGLRQGASPEEHHELLAAMARYVTFFVRNPRKQLSDEAQDTITRLVAMGIVDALEMVDVAKSQDKRIERCPGGFVLALEHRFERAAIGQPGKVIDFRVAPSLFQAAPQALGFRFAGPHLGFEAAGFFQHGLGKIGQGRNDLSGLLDACEVCHLLLKFVAVVRRRTMSGGRVRREGIERVLETRYQLLDLGRFLVRPGRCGDFIQPDLRHGTAIRQALHYLARQRRVASARYAMGRGKIFHTDIESMVEQEGGDLSQDVMAGG